MEGKRQAKISRLVQRELSEIFRRQTAKSGGVLVSVSAVRLARPQHSESLPEHIPFGEIEGNPRKHQKPDEDRAL